MTPAQICALEAKRAEMMSTTAQRPYGDTSTMVSTGFHNYHPPASVGVNASCQQTAAIVLGPHTKPKGKVCTFICFFFYSLDR